jgi:hypothetical protein
MQEGDELGSVGGALSDRDEGAAAADPASGHAETPAQKDADRGGEDDVRGRDRRHSGWGDEGIAGGRAGGTGP